MMYILKPKRQSDGLLVCAKILDFFHIKHTQLFLANAIEGHVDSPSLLSIKEVLSEYGVESVAIRKGAYSYSDFETPFICAIQRESWSAASFTVVWHVTEDTITYLDPISGDTVAIAKEEFENIDKDILLLLDASAPKDEIDYAKNLKTQQLKNISRQLPVYLFILSVLLEGIQLVQQPFSIQTVVGAGFLLSSAAGLLVSILLLWHEVDSHNPFIREVCGGTGKKMNCNAVLSSSGATLFGVSWSVWGFAYFATFFISQVFGARNDHLLTTWSFASLLVSPYILYSLYYQWQVVKQWCPLCLVVQILLLTNLGLSIAGWLYSGWPISTGVYTVATLSILMAVFVLSAYTLIPLIKRAADSRNYEKRWKKLRYHPDIFHSLLDRSERVSFPVEDLGIVVGNPDARNEIIKVCNPYCGPCSKAHPELEHIVANNKDVKLRIIFTANGEGGDIRTPPVQHLLAIQEKYGSEKVHTALDDWYLADKKEYAAFADKYPMNGELKQQGERIKAMREWCANMKIRATPTLYINGRELPDSYRINELKNFF